VKIQWMVIVTTLDVIHFGGLDLAAEEVQLAQILISIQDKVADLRPVRR